MKYKVNIKKTEEGYAVWVLGLPGCWSQGKTEEEALENIKDAIEAYFFQSLMSWGNSSRKAESTLKR